MADREPIEVPTAEYQGLENHRTSQRYLDNQRKQREARGITEDQWHAEIIEQLEYLVGPLLPWQRFWVIAAVSGRGVEWAQTRLNPHYHFLGLPCAICGRR
jgi:hypothetical protein